MRDNAEGQTPRPGIGLHLSVNVCLVNYIISAKHQHQSVRREEIYLKTRNSRTDGIYGFWGRWKGPEAQ